MRLGASDDLSIGPFVRRFPGSAMRTGCSACGTWEDRHYDRSLREDDRAMVAFAADLSPRPSAARTVEETGWQPRPLPDPGGILSGGGRDKLDEVMDTFHLDWLFDPPRAHEPPGPSKNEDPQMSEFNYICTELRPPAISEVHENTRLCFDNEEFPITSCDPVCIIPLPCIIPAPDETYEANIVVPDQEWLSDELSNHVAAEGELQILTRERLFVDAALTLIHNNLDLLSWAICLAKSWSPFDSGFEFKVTIDAPVDPVIVRVPIDICLEGLIFNNSWAVHLVAFLKPIDLDENTHNKGANGVATNVYPSKRGPDGRRGPIIPIKKTYWQSRINSWEQGGSLGLCALLDFAGSLIHEAVHLCEDDTNPDCDDEIETNLCCWQEQRMIQNIFTWAYAQRHPCLQSTAGCFAGDPTRFASSGYPNMGKVWEP